MPITIAPFPGQGNFIGWGVYRQLHSDFIGPLPVTAQWAMHVSLDSEVTQPVGVVNVVSQANPTNLRLGMHGESTTIGAWSAAVGQQVFVTAELRDNIGGNVLDSGQIQVPWDTTSTDLPTTTSYIQGTTGGGLTAEQAAQLQRLDVTTSVTQLLDQLTLVNLTPNPSPGPVTADLTFPVFGVIIRMVEIAEGLVPQTPDFDYWVPGLAVLRVFRAGDLWLRVPVHTSSKMISLWGEALLLGLSAFVLTDWLVQLHIEVTFRAGCTGRVLLMRVP